ncbi:MAG: PCMD domain-containing protein [Clostridium sp.]|nr:PCMD domain-containing protein [Clostridium sp.]
MNKRNLLLLSLGMLSLSSCIQEEAPNAECDIESCRVINSEGDASARDGFLTSLFYSANDAAREVASMDSVITFPIREGADVSAIALELKVTPGATVTPASGSVHDFSQESGVRYHVVSEDGKWSRDYRVRFIPMMVIPTEYGFEHFELEPSAQKFYNWFGRSEDGARIDFWATGNSGYRLSRSSALPDEYPTVPFEEGSVSGRGVKLETRSTGAFGNMVNMRIAAGNLFIGTFDTANALKDAMQATCFGLPFGQRPVGFSGYYKFVPGEKFLERSGAVVLGRVDAPDLYAVLYRNTDENGNAVVLHGDDVLTNPNIVAMARVTDPVTSTEWQRFDLDFEYYAPVDRQLLHNFGYNLAVVFTSSIEGASFRGAVGSTLWIDEVKVTCE